MIQPPGNIVVVTKGGLASMAPSTLLVIDKNGHPKTIATGGGTVVWGSITGTLSNQTDLQAALDAKQDKGYKNQMLLGGM